MTTDTIVNKIYQSTSDFDKNCSYAFAFLPYIQTNIDLQYPQQRLVYKLDRDKQNILTFAINNKSLFPLIEAGNVV